MAVQPTLPGMERFCSLENEVITLKAHIASLDEELTKAIRAINRTERKLYRGLEATSDGDALPRNDGQLDLTWLRKP